MQAVRDGGGKISRDAVIALEIEEARQRGEGQRAGAKGEGASVTRGRGQGAHSSIVPEHLKNPKRCVFACN
jgi:hypothetical protein